MSAAPDQCRESSPAVEFHLLGRIALDDSIALQQRLVYESGGRDDGRIDVLICEHPPLITIGRNGSRGHLRLSTEQLQRRHLDVRWVARGGGCILHLPGQLAIYPIVPLRWHGWTVGQYLTRLQRALAGMLGEMQIRTETIPGSFGLAGRSGGLVAIGAAVRSGTTCHGAFLNVDPVMTQFGFIDTFPQATGVAGAKTTMGCLLAERRRPVRMPEVKASLVANLASSFGCQRYHLHTGHPLLPSIQQVSREPAVHCS